MYKPRVCVDIDNVIARTDEVMRRIIRDHTKGRVNFRYQDIVTFDYRACKDAKGESISDAEWQAIHECFSESEHLLELKPFEGIQAHLEDLAGRYNIHLATSRLRKARRATIDWLDKNGFPAHDLHFLGQGEKHSSVGQFHCAVEDHYEQAKRFAETGTTCYLIRHPWNDKEPKIENVKWVSGWPELVEKLLHGNN